MCGIFVSITRDCAQSPDQTEIDLLKARGPDSYRVVTVTVTPACPGDGDRSTVSGLTYLTFASSVLALRGEFVQQQPLTDPSTGSILCWNGEAWKVNGNPLPGNDSATVFDLLLSAARPASRGCEERIVDVLTSIAGPFAFVFYDGLSSTMYYGRDRLGRRSLLVQGMDDGSLTLCSTLANRLRGCSAEVSTDAIHCLRLRLDSRMSTKLAWPEGARAINTAVPRMISISSTPSSPCVAALLQKLRDSLRLRVLNIPRHAVSQTEKSSARIAILFSGGLDCTLLARLTDELVAEDESIDLVNVAFENPRLIAGHKDVLVSAYERCPDRRTGRASFAELCQASPHRTWRFVAVNVPYTEVLLHKSTVIRLMHPHNTEMDLSIAMALFFAARGQGFPTSSHHISPPSEIYSTTARVLLSGLGADELFAGYSRHSAAFARGGFADLVHELELDFNRIGSRNLGRDDRVMSHWSKEVRYPYLDEDVVRFALDLPVWEKCGFRLGRKLPKQHEDDAPQIETIEDLEPAKMLLRIALWRLGLKKVAAERKRAIQFGARTAKMGIGRGKTKGTDVVLPDDA